MNRYRNRNFRHCFFPKKNLMKPVMVHISVWK
jgi:hypothetical protein